MNKMIKRISVFFFALILLVSCFSFSAFSVSGVNNKTDFSDKIKAVTPLDGEVVNILPEDIDTLWKYDGFDEDLLNSLYAFSRGSDEFVSSLTVDCDEEAIRKIYDKTDDFRPINNVLKWQDDLTNVVSYKVRVALDRQFTKCVLIKENASKLDGVFFENPYTNTTYFWQVIATLNNGDKVYSEIFDFTTENTIRTIYIDGVSNTRDVGGFEGEFGYVKEGLVYRSARLESCSTKGLAQIKRLGIKTDLDLRGTTETIMAPDRLNPLNMENFEIHPMVHYASFTGDWDVDETLTGIGINNSMNFSIVRDVIKVFADIDNYPIDFHCAVGRDRTGTLSVLLETLLGRDETSIYKNYVTSLFSTTGSWRKSSSSNLLSVYNLMAYLNSFRGANLAEKTANYMMTKLGITQSEIDTIRNIMTGKPGYEVELNNTTGDVDNYDGFNFVTFNCFGKPSVTSLVRNGEKVIAPYALADGEAFVLNGEIFDFNNPITEDVVIDVLKPDTFTVRVNDNGTVNEYKVISGKNFDFSLLGKSGKKLTVLDDNGKIITSLKVEKDCVINVLYN